MRIIKLTEQPLVLGHYNDQYYAVGFSEYGNDQLKISENGTRVVVNPVSGLRVIDCYPGHSMQVTKFRLEGNEIVRTEIGWCGSNDHPISVRKNIDVEDESDGEGSEPQIFVKRYPSHNICSCGLTYHPGQSKPISVPQGASSIFHASHQYVVSWWQSKIITGFFGPNRELVFSFKIKKVVRDLAISPNGNLLLVAHATQVSIYSIPDARHLATYHVPMRRGWMSCAWSEDQISFGLLSPGEKTITVFDNDH